MAEPYDGQAARQHGCRPGEMHSEPESCARVWTCLAKILVEVDDLPLLLVLLDVIILLGLVHCSGDHAHFVAVQQEAASDAKTDTCKIVSVAAR